MSHGLPNLSPVLVRQPPAYRFGSYRLACAQRHLFRDDRPVRLSPRTLDLLNALVERAGEVIGKEELLARAWPREVVEDDTLRVEIAALRRVLSDDHGGMRFIANVPGRGYSFVAPVRIEGAGDTAAPDVSEGASLPSRRPGPPGTEPGGLPPRPAHLFGRDSASSALAEQLRCRQLISIVAAGGMGKTSLAVAVAERVRATFADGVRFVDLASVDGAAVPAAFAQALGLSMLRGTSHDGLAEWLADKQLLLVLDNCEHVLEALAAVLSSQRQRCPGLRYLATSREPLGLMDEQVHRLGALDCPEAGTGHEDAATLLVHPAVQLFVERASAASDGFRFCGASAAAVAELCRRLDGHPLAIELAAARCGALGPEALLAQLDAELLTLPNLQSAAALRHRTLGAMLHTSYGALAGDEQTVLKGMAVFAGRFPLGAGESLVLKLGGSAHAVLQAAAALVRKSLVKAPTGQGQPCYALHPLTRHFVLQRLRDDGQFESFKRAHADFVRAAVSAARRDWSAQSADVWLAHHGWLGDELHEAIVWELTQPDRVASAVDLVADTWMFATRLTRFDEFGDLLLRVQRSLQPLSRECRAQADGKLAQALSSLMLMQAGPLAARAQPGEPARAGDTVNHLIERLMLTFAATFTDGEYATTLRVSEQLAILARDAALPVPILVSDRMRAQSHHFLGQHDKARTLIERVLSHPVRRGEFGAASGIVDHQVSMRIVLARALWLQGQPDRAARLVDELMTLARQDGSLSLCQAIAFAALPLACWRGESDRVQALLQALRAEAAQKTFQSFFEPWLEHTQALLEQPAHLLDPVPVVAAGRHAKVFDHLVTFDSRYVTEAAYMRVQHGRVGWCGPEVLRAYAERLLVAEPGSERAARAVLEQALAMATAQRALAWELRAAMSLLRWEVRYGRHVKAARARLVTTCSAFGEGGQETRDLAQAGALLDDSDVICCEAGHHAAPMAYGPRRPPIVRGDFANRDANG